VIQVERAWDAKGREYVETKSRAGRRTVPIPAVLRDSLDEHVLRLGWGEGLLLGRTAGSRSMPRRFRTGPTPRGGGRGWRGIRLHEARHTFASLMIAAGVNSKVLSTVLGHASVAITLDRYDEAVRAQEREAAGLLDAYLARADSTARVSRLGAETEVLS